MQCLRTGCDRKVLGVGALGSILCVTHALVMARPPWPKCSKCNEDLFLVREDRTTCEACRLGIPRGKVKASGTVAPVEEEEEGEDL